MRKIISLLLALCLVVGMVPMAASASSTAECSGDDCTHAVAIDSTHYDTLQEAINAVSADVDNTVISVLKDLKPADVNADKKEMQFCKEGQNVTLELNHHKIVTDNLEAINIDAANVTLTIQNGIIQNYHAGGDVSDGLYAFSKSNNLTLTLDNVTLNSRTQTLAVQGLTNNSNVTIRNSTLSSKEELGIYYPPKSGTLTIENSVITAGTGVVVKGGTVNILGEETKIVATGNKVVPEDYYTGATDGSSSLTMTGDALYVESGYNDRDIVVNVQGGLLESTNSYAIQMFTSKDEETSVTRDVTVTGGTFSSDVSAYLADGYTMIQKGDGEFVAEELNENNSVAKIGNEYFDNLGKAFDEAKKLDTAMIDLLSDAELNNKIIVETSDNITLNLNGHSIKPSSSFNFGTNTLFINRGTLIINGEGTIEGDGDSYLPNLTSAIENSGNLIVKSATIIGASWAIDSKKGDVLIEGGTLKNTKTADNKEDAAIRLSGNTQAEISGTAKIEGYNTAVRLYGANLSVSGDVEISGKFGVSLFNSPSDNSEEAVPSSFTMTGGIITATSGFSLSGNNLQSAGCEAEITGGKLEQTSGETCIYWPMEGKLTVGGNAIVEGGSGIEARMGTITIQDSAAIKGTREYLDLTEYEQDGKTWPASGSSQADGSAILISSEMYGDSKGQYQSDPGLTVNIKGGTLTSEKGNAVTVYNLESTSNENTEAAINVTDGTLNAADGKAAVLVEAKNEESKAGLKTSEEIPSVETKASKTVVTVSSNVVSAVADQAGKTAFYAEGDDFDVDSDTAPTQSDPLNLFVLKDTSIHSAALGNEHTTLTVPEDVELYVTSENEDYVVQETTNQDGNTTYKLIKAEGGGEVNVPEAPTSVVLSANKTTAYKGEKITLTATVEADESAQLEYAWYKDGAFIGKTDSSTYAITEGGSYTVSVRAVKTGESETVYSNAIQSEPVSCSFVSRPTYPSNPGGNDKPEEPTFPFIDVKSTAWYYDAVKYVYENNLMAGTGDTTFDPEVSLTRAMTAQILYNLEGQPKVDEEATFADMNEAPTWSVDAIAWAQDTGVVAGMGDNQFAPNLKVTREQFAQMMYNYAKYKKYDLTKTGDLSKFPDDSSVSDWAETAMSWANGNGLINGHEDSGLIDPAGNTIRGQAASIIMNFDLNVVK